MLLSATLLQGAQLFCFFFVCFWFFYWAEKSTQYFPHEVNWAGWLPRKGCKSLIVWQFQSIMILKGKVKTRHSWKILNDVKKKVKIRACCNIVHGRGKKNDGSLTSSIQARLKYIPTSECSLANLYFPPSLDCEMPTRLLLMLRRKRFGVPRSCQEFEHNDRVREVFGNYGAIHRGKKRHNEQIGSWRQPLANTWSLFSTCNVLFFSPSRWMK